MPTPTLIVAFSFSDGSPKRLVVFFLEGDFEWNELLEKDSS